MEKYNPEGFSLSIFKSRYAISPEETWEEACERVAMQMAIAEQGKSIDKYYKIFLDELTGNRFCPGGRIWAGSGKANPNLLNCFVMTSNLDSKQGWAKLTHDVIITSMCGGGCGINASDIRPEDSLIANGGTCPGPIELIRLVDSVGSSVRTGGGRRMALMCALNITHPDILKFVDLKTNQGKISNANISVQVQDMDTLVKAIKEDTSIELAWKGKYKKEVPAKLIWDKIVNNAYNYAEPGLLNWDLVEKESTISYINTLQCTNPCQPKYATVLTPSGISTIGAIKIGDTIWAGSNWTKVIKKWSTGIKPVYKYSTATGHFVGTENHRILQNEVKIEVKDASSIDWNIGPIGNIEELNPQDIMDGLVIGDGSVHKASNNLVHLYIGIKDNSYFDSEISELILKHRPGLKDTTYEIKTTIEYYEIPHTYLRTIPNRFLYGNSKTKKGFLRGLFSANGSICENRVTLKQTSKILIEQVQLMLSSLGIHSYITVNKEANVTHRNGEYKSKKSYDLNITSGRTVFKEQIGFIQPYKQERIIESGIPKYKTSDIKNIEYLEDTEVFDITVEDINHTYWSGGCLISNCGELPLSDNESCCLASLVLHRFVKNGKVDYETLGQTIRVAVRFLDNVHTVNTYPLPEMKQIASNLRRIGLGVTGLADMLCLLDYRYGSDKANSFLDELFRFISKQAYEASIILAVEKGAFPLCNPEEHIKTGYVKRMTSKIKSLIKEHGIRNAGILAIAPTGTTSILSGNCSSGVEPIFSPAYERRYWVGNVKKTELVFHPLFKEYLEKGKDVSCFIGANELTAKEHMEVQRVIQKHIDGSISKTINLPEHYSIEDMSKIWLEYLPVLKGITFYRENSRTYVDGNGIVQEPPLKSITIQEAISRYTKEVKAEAQEQTCKNGVCEL